MSKEAMKLALYALEDNFDIWTAKTKAIIALREALAEQPAQQEPVADEQKDAARYRWLRNPTTDVSLVLDKRTNWVPQDETVPSVGGYWEYEYRAGEELDEAIDSAIEAAHGIKGDA